MLILAIALMPFFWLWQSWTLLFFSYYVYREHNIACHNEIHWLMIWVSTFKYVVPPWRLFESWTFGIEVLKINSLKSMSTISSCIVLEFRADQFDGRRYCFLTVVSSIGNCLHVEVVCGRFKQLYFSVELFSLHGSVEDSYVAITQLPKSGILCACS